MVRDVTMPFVDRYLAPLLGALKSANTGADGKAVPADQLMLKLDFGQVLRQPRRSAATLWQILRCPAPYRLLGWIAGNAGLDLVHAPLRLLPAGVLPRYRALPAALRGHARYAERELRRVRWIYLRLSTALQLDLTTAQIALQRLGQLIEWLVSMLALCHHAATQDASQWRVADLQCLLLREKGIPPAGTALFEGVTLLMLRSLRRTQERR